MSTDELPEEELREPAWSLATAFLFVVLWLALSFMIQAMFVLVASSLVAISRDVSFEQATQTFAEPEVSTVVAMGGIQVLVWVATFGIIARLLDRYPRPLAHKALGLTMPVPRWSLVAAIPIGLVLQFVGMFLGEVLKLEEPETFERLLRTPWGAATLTFLALAIAPVAEEAFFRGFVLPPMARRWSAATAAGLNGLLFAAVHFPTYGVEGLGFLPALFLFGYALAALRLWTRSIGPCIIAHFVFNLTSLVLFFALPDV